MQTLAKGFMAMQQLRQALVPVGAAAGAVPGPHPNGVAERVGAGEPEA